MDFDADLLLAPGPAATIASLGALHTVNLDSGCRSDGPRVSVSVGRESADPRGFAVYVNAANGPMFTRARNLTIKAAARIANIETAILRSAYAAGMTDARNGSCVGAWLDSAASLAAEIKRNLGGGNHADARALAADANALASGEGE